MMSKSTPYQCLCLRGDPRVGKTRILQEFQEIAEQWNWNSLMISVNQMVSSNMCLIHTLISSVSILLMLILYYKLLLLWKIFENLQNIICFVKYMIEG